MGDLIAQRRAPDHDPHALERARRVEIYRDRVTRGLGVFEEHTREIEPRAKPWHFICLHCGVTAPISRHQPHPPGWRVLQCRHTPVTECPACVQEWDEIHSAWDRVLGRQIDWVQPHDVRPQRGRHALLTARRRQARQAARKAVSCV
jgi:hypothetical protein